MLKVVIFLIQFQQFLFYGSFLCVMIVYRGGHKKASLWGVHVRRHGAMCGDVIACFHRCLFFGAFWCTFEHTTFWNVLMGEKWMKYCAALVCASISSTDRALQWWVLLINIVKVTEDLFFLIVWDEPGSRSSSFKLKAEHMTLAKRCTERKARLKQCGTGYEVKWSLGFCCWCVILARTSG